ncbi:MAG TPA: ribonuclease Y [Gemmatimonadales bacterium]|jgi:ribonuclease Y
MAADLIGLLAAAALGSVVAGAVFYLVGRRVERTVGEREGTAGRLHAERLVGQAKRDAESAKTDALLKVKEEIMAAREAWDREARQRREEMDRLQERLTERETVLDRKLESLDGKERTLERQRQELETNTAAAASREREAADLVAERRQKLERVAAMSSDEAKALLLQEMTDAAQSEAAARIREIKDEAARTADREAKKIIAMSIQRLSAEHATETTVSAVALPNDDMKGRIIGREGRNIRAFELATGVDVIIDDTPDTVVVSCFDPVRREVARRSLEQLITDGRIHPGRIEEVVAKVKAELERQLEELGEQTVYELGIRGMHRELVKLVGRMKYRTSYGQNILDHSKEVAALAGMMAAELKLDVHLAKRGALLHDIGKALTHQHEGTHVELGVEVATRHGEHPIVINCIAAHHDDVPHETPISMIVQAADAASGARPGARRESFDTYVKRLQSLEQIATGFTGVEKAFAIQAGREIRIAVMPDQIDDVAAAEISEQIARRIEQELQYPGQIKVVVIRETRAVDFAR